MPNLLKAVIFDMDGVIVDTIHLHFKSWRDSLSEYGIEFKTSQNDALRGLNRTKSLDAIMRIFDAPFTKEQQSDILKSKNIRFLTSLQQTDMSIMLPGAMNLIKSIYQSTLKLAVASSSMNARFILEQLEIGFYFDSILDGNDIKVSKPDPTVFLESAINLGYLPSEIMVIEDSVDGIMAAQNGGFHVCGVGYHFKNKVEGVTYLDNLDGLSVNHLLEY